MIETSGSYLSKIFTVQMVDKRRLISNNIWDVYYTLGIEAARKALLEEIKSVLNFFNIYLNAKNIMILIDTMTV